MTNMNNKDYLYNKYIQMKKVKSKLMINKYKLIQRLMFLNNNKNKQVLYDNLVSRLE